MTKHLLRALTILLEIVILGYICWDFKKCLKAYRSTPKDERSINQVILLIVAGFLVVLEILIILYNIYCMGA